MGSSCEPVYFGTQSLGVKGRPKTYLALQTGWVLKHVKELGVVDLKKHPGDLSS